MKLDIKSGKYVLAVSGGVDSMALLDLLARKPSLELVVAHFNHGIRQDAQRDEDLVKKIAKTYRLPFESAMGNLGRGTSEAIARQARYTFLGAIRDKHQAFAIVTAHHQDDMIETVLINLLRGSGRQGLSAISSNRKVLRPLLDVSKPEIVEYARQNNLEWREDSTNDNPDYLRNYLRLKVLPGLSEKQREALISNIDKVAKINKKLDIEIAKLSHNIGSIDINRQAFSGLPAEVGAEYIAYLLRQRQVRDYDSKTINRLSLAIKTAKPRSQQPIKQSLSLKLETATASLVTS